MAMMATAMTNIRIGLDDSLECLNSEKSLAFFLGKMSAILSTIFRIKQGYSFVNHPEELDYELNFLKTSFKGHESEHAPVTDILVCALKNYLILHAEHGINCSTFTVQTVGSAHAGVSACLSAGIHALSGDRHGGATKRVVEMFKNIIKDIGEYEEHVDANKKTKNKVPLDKVRTETIKKYINAAKRKEAKAKVPLMGFGHRVYKVADPRAGRLKKMCQNIFHNPAYAEIFQNSLYGQFFEKAFALASELTETTANDEYFKSRRIYPNVDFYGGLFLCLLFSRSDIESRHLFDDSEESLEAYKDLSIRLEKDSSCLENIFPCFFAFSRLAGWLAHLKESSQAGQRIVRPSQIYVGELPREVEVDKEWEIGIEQDKVSKAS